MIEEIIKIGLSQRGQGVGLRLEETLKRKGAFGGGREKGRARRN